MARKEPDVSTVFSPLRDSLNLDQTLRARALFNLSNYETRPGFCSRLMDIISAKDPPYHDDVRLAASIYFRDTIECYWINSLYLSNYEKTNLRVRLLSHLQEENDQIAQILAIIISNIARIDYPLLWPGLFSFLALQHEKADILTSRRIFEVLSQTILKLLEKDLTDDGTSLAEISSQLFDCCWSHWKNDKQTIYNSLSLTESFERNTSLKQKLRLMCDRWLCCLSLIQSLFIQFEGDAKSVKVPPVKEVCSELINAVIIFVPFYSRSLAHPKLSFIHEACVNIMKCLVKILYYRPDFFGDVTVLQTILGFCLKKIMNPENEKSTLFDQLLIECMVMVKSALKCINDYPSFKRPNFGKNVWRNISEEVKSLLPDERVKALCEILITRYFPLTTNELEEWSQDPKAYYHKQSMFGDMARPCETLYMVLFENYSELLGPFVISILDQAMNGGPVKEKEEGPVKEKEQCPEILLKEAAYTAVGHVYYELSDKLNFNELFTKFLYPDICDNRLDMRMVHRKIAFLVKEWACVEEGHTRKPVFKALIRLLGYDDLVVRLAACDSLRYLAQVNDLNEDFTDLLPSCWDLCFKLIENVIDIRSKVLALACILSTIKCIGKKVVHADKLEDVFQEAWKVSIGDSELQIRVLEELPYFVSELGINSPGCYNMLLPILKVCIVGNDARSLILLKDGMLLWQSIISHAPSMDSELLDLFPSLPVVMKKSFDYFKNERDDDFDHLKVANKILDGYIRLGGKAFMSEHASIIVPLREGIVEYISDKKKKEFLPRKVWQEVSL